MPPKKLTDLKVSPDNPREIQADRMAALVRSLREDPEMMQARPLLVRKDGTVIAGNMRLLAARELGWETIPTITVDLTDERARLWMLRDNNAYGEWEDEALAGLLLAMQEDGTDLELTGFGADEIDKLLASVGPHETDADPDAVPDVPEEAESKLGEVYELGRHRLMCGDATSAEDVAKLMDGAKADMVLTDPPYAFGLASTSKLREKAGGWHDMMNNASWFRGLYASWRALVEEGPLWVFCNWRTLPILMRAASDAGVGIHSVAVWHKDWIGPGGMKGLRPSYEMIALTTVGDYAIPDRGVPDFLEVAWSSHKPHGHGAEKPAALMERLMEISDVPSVLDPFGGSGSTLIAAERLSRTCYMMELEPKYCDVIRRRYAEYVGETDGDSKKKPATPPVG